MLGTRGRRWRPQPRSPEDRNGQGSSLGTLTWPLSSKGLIGPFFLGGGIRGGPGTSSKLPGGWEQWGHCGSCGVRAGCWHRQRTRGGTSPRARLPAGSLPRCCQRQRHPPSPHLAGRAQTPGTSSTWRALQLCPRCHPDCHDPTGSRGMWARMGWGWGLTRQDVCL